MNVQINLVLDNLPDDLSLEEIERAIRCQLNEWLDFDRHPDDVRIVVLWLV